jgi:hypothetical protein
VDTGSREENASKQESRAPVLIQSEPEMLQLHFAGVADIRPPTAIGRGGQPRTKTRLDRLKPRGKPCSFIARLTFSVANICTATKQKMVVENTSELIKLAVEMHHG